MSFRGLFERTEISWGGRRRAHEEQTFATTSDHGAEKAAYFSEELLKLCKCFKLVADNRAMTTVSLLPFSRQGNGSSEAVLCPRSLS